MGAGVIPLVNLACILVAQPDYGAIERDAMRARVADERVRARVLRGKEGSILEGLDQIDQQLVAGRTDLVELTDAAAALEVERVRTSSAMQASRAELATLRAAIGRRMASMMRLRKRRLTDLVASADSMGVARRVRDGLRHVADHDGRLLRRARTARAASDRYATELTRKQEALAENRVATERAMADGEVLRAERAALLEIIRNERQHTERLAGELSRAAKKLDRESDVIRGLLPPPPPRRGGFDRQRGRLPWPVTGRVEATFGKLVDVSSKLILVHHGIDIRAPFGVNVRAPFGGRVAESTWVDGFGNVLIIDHGQRRYSLYGHLDQVDVSPGDIVEAGQIVATLGDSGSDKGAHLYFGIRRRRTAVDPLVWLAP